MFTYALLHIVGRNGQKQGPAYHCAVNVEDGMVIHFCNNRSGEVAAHIAIEAFNTGVGDPPSTYNMVKPSECVYADSGELLVPTLDGPVAPEFSPVVVNVLGLNYAVPKPVADQLATVQAALTAACIRAESAERAAAEALASLMDGVTDR